MTVRILKGDCRDILRAMPDESVHCVVTSPPYWGLRDYGTAKWNGGDPECDHGMERVARRNAGAQTGVTQEGSPRDKPRSECKCGARRIDNQIGLEGSITDYIETMVDVFREVRRVLRKDGTLWLNLGDSYCSGGRATWRSGASENMGRNILNDMPRPAQPKDLKPKDLIGIPWRVAFALQADGWYLRSDIIWSKPNPMPESVTDRPTKAHEYIFLLSRSERYFYDAEAIAEPNAGIVRPNHDGYRSLEPLVPGSGLQARRCGNGDDGTRKRNKRTVWEIATFPYPEAHFATFPPALIEPCILAGCLEKACAKCGAPWVRETERGELVASGGKGARYHVARQDGSYKPDTADDLMTAYSKITVGFFSSCSCNAGTVPGTVLDPFGGAGTTGLVADRHGRNAILIELNPDYADMAERRIKGDSPLFAEVL